jgi:hypothetical protein
VVVVDVDRRRVVGVEGAGGVGAAVAVVTGADVDVEGDVEVELDGGRRVPRPADTWVAALGVQAARAIANRPVEPIRCRPRFTRPQWRTNRRSFSGKGRNPISPP